MTINQTRSATVCVASVLYAIVWTVYCVVVLEVPGWPVLSMMTHVSCDQPWLISRLREDKANQWPLVGLQSADCYIAAVARWTSKLQYLRFSIGSPMSNLFSLPWRVTLNSVKSHVQQASVIAAPVRLFTCHSTGHASCPHRAVPLRHCWMLLLLLLLLLMQMLPSSTETPYAVLWRADVRLILTTPRGTAVNELVSLVYYKSCHRMNGSTIACFRILAI